MSDNIENLILEHLRVIRSDITALRDDSREIKGRLAGLEQSTPSLRGDHAHLFAVNRRANN